MNSFLAGALGAVGGSASAYGDTLEKQREYKMEQKKLQAEATRKENFARFDFNLRQTGNPSGFVTKEGRQLTNADIDSPSGKPDGAISEYEFKRQVEDELRVKKEKERLRLKKEKVSTSWTTREGDPLTEGEVEVILAEEDGRSKLMNTLERDVIKQEHTEAKRVKKEKNKAKSKALDDFKRLNTNALKKRIDPYSLPEKVDTVLQSVDQFQENEDVMQLLQVKHAIATNIKGYEIIAKIGAGEKREDIEAEMLKKGIPKENIAEMFDYAEYHAPKAPIYNLFDWGKKGDWSK